MKINFVPHTHTHSCRQRRHRRRHHHRHRHRTMPKKARSTKSRRLRVADTIKIKAKTRKPNPLCHSIDKHTVYTYIAHAILAHITPRIRKLRDRHKVGKRIKTMPKREENEGHRRRRTMKWHRQHKQQQKAKPRYKHELQIHFIQKKFAKLF